METLESPISYDILDESSLLKHASAYKPNQMLVINNFLDPKYVIDHLVPAVDSCTPYINRVKVPNFKKSGSVSSQNLKIHAPELVSIYQSPIMKEFVEKVVGEPVMLCPEADPHAVALYYYTEPGDHIGVHYDKSFYKGKRYTVLLGLVQDSTQSKLVCYPGANKLNRRKNPMDVLTHPGTLVIFNGDSLWHEVTPLGENEKRVILTMEFVTDNKMTRWNRFISHTKDRFLYFGKSSNKS